jgi:uncharacterized cupredoxin-like copper-binding protein
MGALGRGAGGGDRRPRPAPHLRPRTLLAVVVVALAAASCARASAEGRSHLTVDVRIHHSAFAPAQFTFTKGTTVTFVIHNTDPIEHEFIVGDETVQYYIEHTAHPAHDGSVPGQISIPPGQTRTTTYTFTEVTRRPGDMEFACHLPGHFRYGMHGPITITA